MMNQVLALTWKELKVFFKDTGAVVFIFLQPFVFIVIMSYAMSGMFAGDDHPVQLLVVNADRGARAASVITQLSSSRAFVLETEWEGQTLTPELAQQVIMAGKRNIVLLFPSDFSEALEQPLDAPLPRQTKVTLLVDPATPTQVLGPILGTVQGFVDQAAQTAMLPHGVGLLYQQLAPSASDQERTAFIAQAEKAMSGAAAEGESRVTLEQATPPGMHAQKYPNTFQQNVPSYTIYGIFWIVSQLAGSVLLEKRDGTFRRLLVAPMSRAAMLAGKFLPFFIINLFQIAIMLGTSHLLFGLELGSSPMGLVAVSVAAAATATGLGVLVAALASTEAQIGGLTTLLLLTMSALGGAFIPRFAMPEWLREIGLATPHAWALDAFQDLFVRGYGFTEIVPKLAMLAIFALAFFTVGVWRFRFE